MAISTTDLETLGHWLTGEFDNPDQALAQPIWFVRLRLWQRSLPQGLGGQLAFFAEQANALYLDRPYRQRVFTLTPAADSAAIVVQYYACKDPERWCGAGAQPKRLAELSPVDLERLPGCELLARWQGDDCIAAQPPAGCHCFFEYQNEKRQVVLGFEARRDRFLSFDRGVDPVTGRALWGALMGPYEFTRLP
ncbi:MAG: chromophore lyase CpcT/CpeT [Cyanobacteria bacterium J06641_5]